jgi:hypothetical protein
VPIVGKEIGNNERMSAGGRVHENQIDHLNRVKWSSIEVAGVR